MGEGPAYLESRCVHLEPLGISRWTARKVSVGPSPVEHVKRGGHDFGHHASPSNHVSLTFLTSPPLQINDGFQQTVEMIISRIIELLK